MNKLTKKELFLADFRRMDRPSALCVAIVLPTGAVEIITNTSLLKEKMLYYDIAYDDDLKHIKVKDVSIKRWMIV